MSTLRKAGYVSINGEPYLVQKDKDNLYAYERKNTPKKNVVSTKRNTKAGESNLIEVSFNFVDGFGDETMNDERDTYHYALNLFTERESELVVLPGVLQINPDTTIPSGASNADINLLWSAPVFVWEQTTSTGEVETFFLGDHRAFTIRTREGMSISLDEDMFFEGATRPTGGTVFNNTAYAAMGGGKESQDRFIRRRSGTTGLWTNDDNNPLSITSAADGGGGTVTFMTSTTHGYEVGDVVYISSSTVSAYDGLRTITAVPTTTTFKVSLTFSATCTATVNVQDSDVKAEQLAIVGDEMVRTAYDSTNGWQTSRVDIVGSNELLVSNWTAGIGTLNVGDKDSTPTALVPFGNGELVMKPEGVFKYDSTRALYVNVIPELAQHRHPDNGRGSFEYKGWVYIPTVIGLLRYKNSIVQDVTPGRGGSQAFDTPIGPIGFITGDANRMYAVTQPFRIDQPQQAADTVQKFGYNLTALTPVTLNTDVFDGDETTKLNITTLTTGGALYFGSSQQFHRIHLEITDNGNQVTGGSTLTVEVWADTNGDGVGDAWVTKDVYYDGTRGWQNTDNDPTSLFQSGDIVFGPRVNASTGEDTWDDNANTYDSSLTAGFYWARVRISVSVGGSNSTYLETVSIGLHSSTSFEPYHTTEIANDHGGVVYVLSMTEEQGRSVVWRTLWALAVPDLTRDSKYYGGPQRVGACKIVQPGFMRSHLTGDRYLFLGLQNVSYLCPLGNHPDPTNQPYAQWYPNTSDGVDGGSRPVVVVTPYTDFGLPADLKTFKEIEFQTNGVDLSGVEVWYSVDYGAWTFLGYGDDFSPNMPMVFTEQSEPSGYALAVAISYDAESERTVRLDSFSNLVLRAQPRPEMAEIIQMTLELDVEQNQPGAIQRMSAETQYARLRTLQTNGTTVPFININGAVEYGHVLQVTQRAMHNTDNKPVLYADVVFAISTAVSLAG